MTERALRRLRAAQIELNRIDRERLNDSFDKFPDYRSRLLVTDLGGTLAVEYYGAEYEEAWETALGAIGHAEVAPTIALLRISGPDQGANGLREYDFAPLLALRPTFSNLLDCYIRPTDPGDHNASAVKDDQLPRLLAGMPRLRTLTLPQAPEPAFFDLDLGELRMITTGMEWRTRGFIEHLSAARRLGSLTMLDFTDSSAPWLSTKPQSADWSSTPASHYERLLQSDVGTRLRGLRLRNAKLTEADYRRLQAIRPELQFSVVLAAPHVYVSHWGRTEFPYKHLLPFG
jgi:hypothetical protein